MGMGGRRAALVTGGSSGMGKAMARVLVEEGYAVTISGRDAGKLRAAADELRAAGAEGADVQGVRADVADEAAIVALVDAHRSAYGGLDVLVNSAGDGTAGIPVAALTSELLDRNLAVNLRAFFLTMHHCMELLLAAGAEHGKALVVNVSSMAARPGSPGISFYSAAKAGVIALTEAAQAENLYSGVQFTAFLPGITATPMADWVYPAGVKAEEMVQPSDLGEGLRFLLRTSSTCLVREIEFAPPAQQDMLARIRTFFSGRPAAAEH